MPSSCARLSIRSTSACKNVWPHPPPSCMVPTPTADTFSSLRPSLRYFIRTPVASRLSREDPYQPLSNRLAVHLCHGHDAVYPCPEREVELTCGGISTSGLPAPRKRSRAPACPPGPARRCS